MFYIDGLGGLTLKPNLRMFSEARGLKQLKLFLISFSLIFLCKNLILIFLFNFLLLLELRPSTSRGEAFHISLIDPMIDQKRVNGVFFGVKTVKIRAFMVLFLRLVSKD